MVTGTTAPGGSDRNRWLYRPRSALIAPRVTETLSAFVKSCAGSRVGRNGPFCASWVASSTTAGAMPRTKTGDVPAVTDFLSSAMGTDAGSPFSVNPVRPPSVARGRLRVSAVDHTTETGAWSVVITNAYTPGPRGSH